MTLTERIEGFSGLGKALRSENWGILIENAYRQNGWFTPDSCAFAIANWGTLLTDNHLADWAAHYPLNEISTKKIGVVSAGNIPLAGFHDFLCTLLANHTVLIKLSAKDDILLKGISQRLIEIAPGFKDRIQFVSGVLPACDAIIATGSDNAAKHFEYYFKNTPHIVRRNRNSVAVLDGHEKEEEIIGLARDIFTYFGLGCRNVSKVFIPTGYDLDLIFRGLFEWKEIAKNNKYISNYEYNKTLYLLNKESLLENGFIVLKESSELSSPVGVLFYEYYSNLNDLKEKLVNIKEKIQCVVNSKGEFFSNVKFGEAQCPKLFDYADGFDTLQFLTNLPTLDK